MEIIVVKSRWGKYRRRGISMIETAMAMVIMSIILGTISVMMSENSAQMRAKASADKMLNIHEAAKGYITANQGSLLASTVTDPVVILAGRPTMGDPVPVDSLQEAGFLPTGFLDVNGYGQRHALIVRQPTAGRLEAMVTTYGGRNIPDGQLGRIAGFIGAAGGYVSDVHINASDAGHVIGTYGGWRTPVSIWGPVDTAPAAGHVQATLAFENGDLLTDYLYRHDIGIEAANTMYTDIHMDNNQIFDVDTITGSDTGAGRNLYIEGNLHATIDVWTRDIQASRHVMAYGHVAAGGSVTAGDDVVANRDLRSGRNLSVGNNGFVANDFTVGGNATVTQNLSVAESLTANDIETTFVNSDTVVHGYGNFTKERGVKLGDLLPKMVQQYTYRITNGDYVPKPVCQNGGTPRVVIIGQQDAIIEEDLWWKIDWGFLPETHVGVAQTFCSYA